MDKPTAGLRKRQEIRKANRMMFLWVAGMSAIVGIALVLSIFLVQKIIFGEKVISEKNHTVSVLDKNLSKVDALKDNIRVLSVNEALASTKLNDSDSALRSVLDALPAEANSTSLASSLQTKLLTGVPGIVVETINVEPVNGVETLSDTSTSNIAPENQIDFSFSVSTDSTSYDSLRLVLERIEKSIRPLDITNITVEAQGKRVVMTAKGSTYYDPAKSVQLTQKVVKP